MLVLDLLIGVAEGMAPFFNITVCLSTKIVLLVLYITNIIFDFRGSSDVLDVRFVHEVVLSCLRKVLLSNHSAVRLRLLHIDRVHTLTNSLEHRLI